MDSCHSIPSKPQGFGSRAPRPVTMLITAADAVPDFSAKEGYSRERETRKGRGWQQAQ